MRLRSRTGQLAVPAGQHGVELRAVPAPGPRYDQDAEGLLQLAAGPGHERVRVVAGHAEHAGHLVSGQAMAQLELEHFVLGRGDAGQGVADQGAQLGLFHVRGDVRRLVGHLRGLLERRLQAAAAQLPQALVAGHRVQPGPQPLRVAE